MGIDILNYLKKSSEETRQAYQESIDLANQIKREREDHDNRDAHEANAEAAQADHEWRDRDRPVPDLTIPELAERAGFRYLPCTGILCSTSKNPCPSCRARYEEDR